MNKYIKCPVCNKEFQRININHVRSHGFDSKDEFLKAYPNTKFNSDLDSIKRSKAAKDSYTEEMRNKAKINGVKNLICYNKSQWEGEEGIRRKELRSKEMRKIATDPEIQKKAALNRVNVKSETRSVSMKLKWLDDEYAEKVIKNSHRSLGQMTEYDNGFFRSSWESKLAKNLSKLNVYYEYESLTFKYIYEGKNKKIYSRFLYSILEFDN